MGRTIFFLLAAMVVHFVTTSSTMNSSVSTNNNSRDLDALLAFKATIFDPQNILPLNWSTSTSICNWIGITCNIRHRRVAAIDLSRMGLIGTIPPQLGNLSFLVSLNIVNNSFHGNLPSELTHLRRLYFVNLAGNAFDGGFPSWLGALSELRFVSIAYNRFSGPLSSVLGNATKLEKIQLSYNFFNGSIPEECFNHLQNLKWLDMGSNQLRGPLPKALFNLSSLQIFSFSNNSLSGYLPARICDHLPQLEGLYLSMNNFHGEIPSGIGKCSRLQILSLSENNFGGNIPGGISNLTALQRLFLGITNLQGQIPKGIGNLYNLEILSIQGANLTGVIPQKIGNFFKLEVLLLDNNMLNGLIPQEIFNISTLRILGLTQNDLFGNVPSNLGVMLPNLEKLYLGGNNLGGAILTSISNASRLSQLSIVDNKFSGAIPDSLGNLRFLKYLALEGNNFSYESPSGELSFFNSLTNCRYLINLWLGENPLNGFLPIFFGNLSSSLESIRLQNSAIEGQIPSSIGNLSKLVDLQLDGNSLKGEIPITIRGLKELQMMDFEGNKIEGAIPIQICNLDKLGLLRLSSNMLSGMVPNCIGNNITTLKYLYLNSNNLTSHLPGSLWSLKDILELDLSMNSLFESFPSQIGNLKVLVLMNLSRNQFFGNIPGTIGALVNLQELSLEHNKLEGLIPESLKNMLDLRYLDLSFNNLVGGIPNSLEGLSYLRYFNVSYNKLRGPIPHRGPFLNFTNLSFLSNEALCDAPWLQPCRTFDHKSRKTRVLLFVLLPIGSVLLALAIFFLLIRKLRRKVIAPIHDLFRGTKYERVSFLELRQITDGFSESNLIGAGNFGSVYKGMCADGTIWAIKVFHLQLEGAFKSFDRECEVLRCLRHRNLTKVITACSNPDFKGLVLEYMPNGSLEKWLYFEHQNLNIMQRLDIMIDVACGLEYLHHGYSVPVVHCDLKPSNILLDQEMVGHLSDFGISKLLGDGESVVQTNTLTTFGYIAPEYGLEGLVSTRGDVYSFGITLMETFTRKRPTDEMFSEEINIGHWVQQSMPDSISQVIDVNLLRPEDEERIFLKKIACVSSVFQLALSCTVEAPEERITIKDVRGALEKIKFQFLQSSNNSTSI